MYRRIVTLLLVIVSLLLAWQPVSQGIKPGQSPGFCVMALAVAISR